MTDRHDVCSPGNHPHADRPNWQPADDISTYLESCREGLEEYSDKRACELLGWSRSKLWRVRKAGQLPEELFERLIAQNKMPSWSELAAIAGALFEGESPVECENCPHCGGVLRTRKRVSEKSAQIVDTWIDEQRS